jgi:hypothetical protein
MERCDRFTLTGSRCELGKGHDGKHAVTIRNYSRDITSVPYGAPLWVFEWNDESQTRLADEQGSRFD